MSGKITNPFLDAPLTTKRILLMVLSTVTFIIEVLYGTIKGFIWFGLGRKPKNKAKFDQFHKLIYNFMRWNSRMHPWLSCEIDNPHNEQFKQGAIAICNHQSLIDTLCLLILSPNILFIANRRVIHNPIVRILFHYADYVCVDKRIDYLLDFCNRHTKQGYIVVIFPEGERSKHCEIKRFHSGAFYLSNKLGLDILPLYLHGAGHVLPLGKAFQNKAKLSIRIGQRITSHCNMMGISEQAKAMRHHYVVNYNILCREKENTSYFKYLVISLYDTICKGSYTKKLLLEYNNFAQWIDCDYHTNSMICIKDNTAGVFTLLFALVHPIIPIVLLEKSNCLREVIKNRKCLPHNITFIQNDDETDQIERNILCIDNIVTISTIIKTNISYETENS